MKGKAVGVREQPGPLPQPSCVPCLVHGSPAASFSTLTDLPPASRRIPGPRMDILGLLGGVKESRFIGGPSIRRGEVGRKTGRQGLEVIPLKVRRASEQGTNTRRVFK